MASECAVDALRKMSEVIEAQLEFPTPVCDGSPLCDGSPADSLGLLMLSVRSSPSMDEAFFPALSFLSFLELADAVAFVVAGMRGQPERPWQRSQSLHSVADLSPKYSRMVSCRHFWDRAYATIWSSFS